MAEFDVGGADAAAFRDYALAGRVSALDDDQAKYSLVLSADGGIVDDVIVYRHGPEHFLIIANAGNRDAVGRAFAERAEGFDVVVTDETERTALIAVQGPRAAGILAAVAGLSGRSEEHTSELQSLMRISYAVFCLKTK